MKASNLLAAQSQSIANQILKGLLQQADRRVAQQSGKYFKEPVALLGVSAPAIRRLAREVQIREKADTNANHALAVCEQLLPDQRLEVKVTALVFLARFSKQLDSGVFKASQRWINAGWCNSWAVIDELCIDVLGPQLVRRPAWFRLMRAWHTSDGIWLRRTAMVALVKPARRGLLLDETYSTAGILLNDPDDLVQKSVGWLLREAGKTDMARLAEYLDMHGHRCARTTLRYAIERFPASTRKALLERTRERSQGDKSARNASAKRR